MYENCTVNQLKEKLQKRGLPVSGTKKELIVRLRSKKGSSKKRSSKKKSVKKPSTAKKVTQKRPTKKRVTQKKKSYAGEKVPSNVLDKALYIKVRNRVKNRVTVWPSAYASGQVVSEYKKAGGRYSGKKSSLENNKPLSRWYREKWVNVCKPGKVNGYSPCGRSQSNKKLYPYCRPSVRVTNKTPMTVDELISKYGKKKLDQMCVKKRKKGLPKKGKPVQVKIR